MINSYGAEENSSPSSSQNSSNDTPELPEDSGIRELVKVNKSVDLIARKHPTSTTL